MRPIYEVLSPVSIPEELLAEVAAYNIEADKPWTSVVNIRAPSDYDSRPSHTLSAGLRNFLHDVCDAVNPFARSPRDDCLLIYGNVRRHNDPGFHIGKHQAAFLHVVLKGCGKLHFPGLKDKARRSLELYPGMVFWMNPSIHHEVKGAADYGIASLCATIAFASCRH